MATKPPADVPAQAYECVNCCQSVPSLYITYKDPSNTSLVQCSRCGRLADVYQSFPYPLIILDLLLLRPEVYRHLLRNRGGNTSRERAWHQAGETLRLGGIVVGVDALVRCFGTTAASDVDYLLLFVRTSMYCWIGRSPLLPSLLPPLTSCPCAETFSLLFCISLSGFILGPRRGATLSNHALVPLTLFYSSLPLVFFLVVTSLIWRAEYTSSSPLSSSPSSSATSTSSPFAPLLPFLADLQHSSTLFASPPTTSTAASPASVAAYLASFSRANLRSGLAQVGEARGWASEAVLRKGVGGSSAVVAFSARAVLFRMSRARTVAVLLLAWLLHLVVLHCIDPFLT
ncbi:hypothetical protein JCM10207_008673 [Rhodosporidiobolus poonsookiae]